MNQIVLRSQASIDVDEASSWYDARGPDLGVEFILELDAALERAALSPESYARQYGEVRRVLMHRFPYAVYFIFEDDLVEVLAVLHQHQDQTRLRSRLGRGGD